MNPLRLLAPLAFAALLGCSHSNIQVEKDDGVRFSQYHRIGVLPFKDPQGHGVEIARALEAGLQKMLFEIPDQKALESLAVQYKLGMHSGIGLEAVEAIRNQAGADAIIMGVMTPGWGATSIVMAEMEMGDPVIKLIVRPPGKQQKAFASVDEIASEILRGLVEQH